MSIERKLMVLSAALLLASLTACSKPETATSTKAPSGGAASVPAPTNLNQGGAAATPNAAQQPAKASVD